MKNTIYVIIWIFGFIFSWLLMSCVGFIATDYTWKECYQSSNHWIGIIFIYWWFPSMFIFIDLENN